MDEQSVSAMLEEARNLVEQAPAEALEKLRPISHAHPENVDALRLAGIALRKLGEASRAARADGQMVLVRSRTPELRKAKLAIDEGKVGDAERILKPYLRTHPDDPAATSMLAALAAKIGRLQDSEALLRRTIELAPSFLPARFDLASMCYRTGRFKEALHWVDILIEIEPGQVQYLALKATVLGTIGRVDESLAIYEQLTKVEPENHKLWMQFGNQLKAVGRESDSADAYRRALAFDPSFGDVWWSLANLKTKVFDAEDVVAIRAQLARDDISPESRVAMHFALGKALEDEGKFGPAFESYVAGNDLHRRDMDYRAEGVTELVDESIRTFTPDFFSRRAGMGSTAADPIFIVGMPRSGSTLLEQILSSHPDVEATAELSYIRVLAMELREREKGYPSSLANLKPEECAELAERYLTLVKSHRLTERPHFIDKNPNNWMHVGLIHLILPNAKIIDVRRHPLSCGVSNFRQLFARGQGFSYSLEDMGRYYSDYLRLMRHIDRDFPGLVRRVIYEDLVDELEGQVRALLDDLGLMFNEACLNFQENERAVRTPSSLQVRRPINREGMENWQRYEQFLGPLKSALGDNLAEYRD